MAVGVQTPLMSRSNNLVNPAPLPNITEYFVVTREKVLCQNKLQITTQINVFHLKDPLSFPISPNKYQL